MRRMVITATVGGLALGIGLWQVGFQRESSDAIPVQNETIGTAPIGRTVPGLTKVVERDPSDRRLLVSEVSVIKLADVSRQAPAGADARPIVADGRPELPISQARAAELRAAARNTPVSSRVQILPGAIQTIGGGGGAGTVGTGAEGIDASTSCSGCGNVPPDPEVAVGPDHIVAVSNVAFLVIDRASGVQTHYYFDNFFAGTPNCSGTFDPNVVYDEDTDRFVLGIDANGTHYCIAANAASGDLTTWNRYSFQAITSPVEFFDYPHAGIGVDGVYIGSNIFGRRRFKEGRAFALDKAALYSGAGISGYYTSTGSESMPQPANIKGAFPAPGAHFFITDGAYDGDQYGVWTWTNALSGGALSKTGSISLVAATGVPAAYPIDAPQLGSAQLLQANDWRVQDAEQRNGLLYMTANIACNPGGGAVNCARWAVVDPSGSASVVDAGVFASAGEHRTFADLAVNSCGDIAIGYTKTSSAMHPAVFVTGRQAGDPPGTVQPEAVCRAGDTDYDAFDSNPHRWGDYSGMTVAPDGTFYYLGEYSKSPLIDPTFTLANWGTYICEFSYPC